MFASLAFATLVIATPCRTTGALEVYVDADPVTATDSSMSARLCIVVPSRGVNIASMSGRLTVDTTFAQLIATERVPGTPFVANVMGPGSALVAGAAGNSVKGGTILTVRVRLLRPGVLPRIDFTLTELNASDGTSYATRARVAGLEPRCIGARPAVFEVLPPAASVDPGEPLDLRINGCGFHATKNTIRFGEVVVTSVGSTGGAHIRVIVPKEIRSSAGAPPMAVGPGEYDVSVDNGRGASNARRVTLR
jgi:hypothetical protein